MDPDGNFPWLIPIMAGIINMAATWDEGSGFFYHLASFGVGAGVAAAGVGAVTAGLLSSGATIVSSGALLGAGNYTNGAMFGRGDFTFCGFLKSGIIGGASAAVGSVIGEAISPLADKICSGISNKIVSRAVSNAVGGAATGGALGAAFSFNDPETSWLESALKGMRDGALAGAVTGAVQGYYEFTQDRAAQTRQKAQNGYTERGKADFRNSYEKGQVGVNRAIEEFKAQGGYNIQQEVTIEIDGVRTRVDFAGYDSDGVLQLFEVKNGSYARPTHNQSIVIPKLQRGVQFIPRGNNAVRVRLTPGVPYRGNYKYNYIHYR